LVGAPEDLRHESNIHSIHYFLADPHYAGAREGAPIESDQLK